MPLPQILAAAVFRVVAVSESRSEELSLLPFASNPGDCLLFWLWLARLYLMLVVVMRQRASVAATAAKALQVGADLLQQQQQHVCVSASTDHVLPPAAAVAAVSRLVNAAALLPAMILTTATRM